MNIQQSTVLLNFSLKNKTDFEQLEILQKHINTIKEKTSCMKLNKLVLLADAIEKISEVTGISDTYAVVDALIGIAWSEEDAGEIKDYLVLTE